MKKSELSLSLSLSLELDKEKDRIQELSSRRKKKRKRKRKAVDGSCRRETELQQEGPARSLHPLFKLARRPPNNLLTTLLAM